MANWRDTILKDFKRGIARLTLVSDPDGLLTEEGMLAEVKNRGFDLIPFEDPIAFRYAYESNYRSIWDKGEDTDLVVVLRSQQGLEKLPYDLLCAGRKLKYALHRLFPKLNYPVVEALDRSHLDTLFEAYQHHDGSILGERATKEFVLINCFKIVPQLISTPVDLMKVLLSKHYRNTALPEMLDDFLLESVKSKPEFTYWPLADIWKDREAFFRFLQSQWETFLGSLQGSDGTSLVPFQHQDVRAYVDTYFWEGLLTPVQSDKIDDLPEWVHVGVAHDPKANAVERLRRLIEVCRQQMPSTDAPHRDWQKTAQQWAELVVLRWEVADALQADDVEKWSELQADIEKQFGDWMLNRFTSLHNLPFVPQPVMVHHVPRYLAVQRGNHNIEKLALVIIDGLALDQWALLRRSLEAVEPNWRFDDSCLFAWVPTLTSVSRQSIFAAQPPLYFPESICTTSKEETHWCRFWEDQGISRSAIEYVKMVESGESESLNNALHNPYLSIIGVVVNTVDKIMHGQVQGTAGMHIEVQLWLDKARSIFQRLLDAGCAVYITADHGNVASTGMGAPKEGVLVETAGKRARIYDNPSFREEAMSQFPDTVAWPSIGLPPDRHALLPSGLRAFTHEGKEVVSHGGIALEEVIVPFVRLDKDHV